MGQRFSAGKYAKARCDRCGEKIKYQALRKEWTGLKVCKQCWDPKTALEFPTNFPTDPEALRDPRVDNDVEANHGYVQIDSGIGTGFKLKGCTVELGSVTVTVT
jgi:hypothetical protein